MTQPSQSQHTTVPQKQLLKVRLYRQDTGFTDLAKLQYRHTFLNRKVSFKTNLLTWLDLLGLAGCMADRLRVVREQTYRVEVDGMDGQAFFDGWEVEGKSQGETSGGVVTVVVSKNLTVS